MAGRHLRGVSFKPASGGQYCVGVDTPEGDARALALGARAALHGARLAQLLKKPPERLHRELKARYWRILDEAGSVAEARSGLLALRRRLNERAYLSATSVIERDLDALVCHLRFPSQHRKRIRSTNLLERTFVEVRRRRSRSDR